MLRLSHESKQGQFLEIGKALKEVKSNFFFGRFVTKTMTRLQNTEISFLLLTYYKFKTQVICFFRFAGIQRNNNKYAQSLPEHPRGRVPIVVSLLRQRLLSSNQCRFSKLCFL